MAKLSLQPDVGLNKDRIGYIIYFKHYNVKTAKSRDTAWYIHELFTFLHNVSNFSKDRAEHM